MNNSPPAVKTKQTQEWTTQLVPMEQPLRASERERERERERGSHHSKFWSFGEVLHPSDKVGKIQFRRNEFSASCSFGKT